MAMMVVFDGLGLAGYQPMEFLEDDTTVYVDVVVDSRGVPACSCEAPKVVKHGCRVAEFRDIDFHRKATFVRVNRQRWRCQNCSTTIPEPLPLIDDKRNMTMRFWERLATDGVERTFADAAKLNCIDERTIRRVFKEYADQKLRHYTFKLPPIVGMDEKVLNKVPRFVLGNVRERCVLDLLPTRNKADLERYFHAMEGRENVEVITQDMYWAYKEINERYFRRATVVIDKFHVVRYANLAVEAVRKAVQSSLDNDGRIDIKRKNRLLAARVGNLKEDAQWELARLYKAHPILEKAVEAKEFFYGIYDCPDRAAAEREYDDWLQLLPKELEKPFKPLLSFMRNSRWRRLIMNYFDHRYTNAYTESINGLFDQINRAGRGYDFQTLRAKALLRYGRLSAPDAAYDVMSAETDEERDWILHVQEGHGIDLSTFSEDLDRGRFF